MQCLQLSEAINNDKPLVAMLIFCLTFDLRQSYNELLLHDLNSQVHKLMEINDWLITVPVGQHGVQDLVKSLLLFNCLACGPTAPSENLQSRDRDLARFVHDACIEYICGV